MDRPMFGRAHSAQRGILVDQCRLERQRATPCVHGRAGFSTPFNSGGPIPRSPRAALSRARLPPIIITTGHAGRSPASTRSIIEGDIASIGGHAPVPNPTSSYNATLTEERRTRSHGRRTKPRRAFRGATPEETVLISIAHNARKHRGHTCKKRRKCILAFTGRKMRPKAFRCLGWGMFLSTLLVVYLSLAVSDLASGLAFHLLFIITILIASAFFCHALVRICMLVLTYPRNGTAEGVVPVRVSPLGEAHPEKPIPILLARDEEACLEHSGDELAKNNHMRPPPPVYGLWRGSVKMDPNLVHWQKSPTSPTMPKIARKKHSGRSKRPPSYASDGGVQHAVEAQGGTGTSEMLHMHPLERERIAALLRYQ